jgi:hypothetical protein
MNVQLRRAKPASESEIVALEKALGYRLSESFRRFLATNNGAEPETNIFRVGEGNDSGVNQFIPVSTIQEERKLLLPLPRQIYPIAWAEGGNYIVINEDCDGAVFFWDHEIEGGGGMTKLSPDFDRFLESLKPFDPQSIELRPEQVISTWMHPDFQKLIKQ